MPALLDTNVVSELMRDSPDPVVLRWVASCRAEDIFFSAVGEAELRYGQAILTAGRRKEKLILQIEWIVRVAFDGRVLPFDSAAARAYAEIVAKRRSVGRPIGMADGQVAAIALSRTMAVATRNVRDFNDMSINIVDPWIAV